MLAKAIGHSFVPLATRASHFKRQSGNVPPQPSIRISLASTFSGDRRVRITVADNGKGIDAAVRPHIFEPLFTTKNTIGTGLGLWVVREIVEKHRGGIRVRSCTAGNRIGTTFCVTLPA